MCSQRSDLEPILRYWLSLVLNRLDIKLCGFTDVHERFQTAHPMGYIPRKARALRDPARIFSRIENGFSHDRDCLASFAFYTK